MLEAYCQVLEAYCQVLAAKLVPQQPQELAHLGKQAAPEPQDSLEVGALHLA